MKNQLILWLAIFAFAACNSQDKNEYQTFQLGTEFVLKNGETAQLANNDDIQIRFDTVSEDSRCPQGVQCVWAGRATIAITFSENGKSQKGALIMGDPLGTNYSDEAVFGDFTVKLLDVNPHPVANTPVEPAQYTVQLLVSKGD